MLVSVTIDMDSSTDAERYAEVRRLLILVDLLASGSGLGAVDDDVATAVRAAMRSC